MTIHNIQTHHEKYRDTLTTSRDHDKCRRSFAKRGLVMTPDNYKTRIKALGFKSGSSWARFVCIDRTTHFRHLKGDRAIPQTLWRIVEWLEQGKLENPNK